MYLKKREAPESLATGCREMFALSRGQSRLCSDESAWATKPLPMGHQQISSRLNQLEPTRICPTSVCRPIMPI